MNTSKIEYRNCVQIGLYTYPEMVYIGEDNWYKHLQGIPEVDRIILPKQHEQIRYNYYGIDEQPWIITKLEKEYEYIERANWMCMRAEPKTGIYLQSGWGRNKRNFVGGFTLDQIFDCVCNDSGIDTIDVMKMDIEGAEIEVLKHYSFSRKPRLLMIEAHVWFNENACEIVKQIIEQQGYKQILHTPTNLDDTGLAQTFEMHFLDQFTESHKTVITL